MTPEELKYITEPEQAIERTLNRQGPNIPEFKDGLIRDLKRHVIKLLQALAAERKRVEELEKFAKAHEQWEADMILDSKVWSNTPNGLPVIWEEYYDRWVEGPDSLQSLRNKALKGGE